MRSKCFLKTIFLTYCNKTTQCRSKMGAHGCSLNLSKKHTSNREKRIRQEEIYSWKDMLDINIDVPTTCSSISSAKQAKMSIIIFRIDTESGISRQLVFTPIKVEGKLNRFKHAGMWDRVEKTRQILLLKIKFPLARDISKQPMKPKNDVNNFPVQRSITKNRTDQAKH